MKLLDDRDELDELLEEMQREEKVKEKEKAQAKAGQQTSALALPPAPSSALPPGLPPISKEKTPYRVVRLLVRHALTKRGKGKRIGEIAEKCGLTIGQTRRHLKALIADRAGLTYCQTLRQRRRA